MWVVLGILLLEFDGIIVFLANSQLLVRVGEMVLLGGPLLGLLDASVIVVVAVEIGIDIVHRCRTT